ncbi:MAG: hypothetical protein KDM63_20325, partial [Verrucomicrobiae bacterium]|nr:hypothetical protein [Verrucomicrobiae bacterium]
GQFRDEETGWSNYGYRFYVPELGRWINRDPIFDGTAPNHPLRKKLKNSGTIYLPPPSITWPKESTIVTRKLGTASLYRDWSSQEFNLFNFISNTPINMVDYLGLWGYYVDGFTCPAPNFRARTCDIFICFVKGFSSSRFSPLDWLHAVWVARTMMIEACIRSDRSTFTTGCSNLNDAYALYW